MLFLFIFLYFFIFSFRRLAAIPYTEFTLFYAKVAYLGHNTKYNKIFFIFYVKTIISLHLVVGFLLLKSYLIALAKTSAKVKLFSTKSTFLGKESNSPVKRTIGYRIQNTVL